MVILKIIFWVVVAWFAMKSLVDFWEELEQCAEERARAQAKD